MRIWSWNSAALAAAMVVVCAVPARAQLYEDVGTRAQGMSGAFVAVADDATAAWWNPAGFATGATFTLGIEKGRTTQPEAPVGAEPARGANIGGFALGFPSLGLSYYRLRVSQIAAEAPIEPGSQNRQELGGEAPVVRSLALGVFGASVGQSLGDHFVIASTLKLMRGGVSSARAVGTGSVLDQGDDLEVSRRTRVGLDAGAMLAFPHVRVGLSVRNVKQTEFGEGADRIRLKRQARTGIAILARPAGRVSGFTVAADADLMRTATPFGDVRHVSTGAELWLGKRVGLRGGLAANTVGERRATSSTGVSVAVVSGIFLEAGRTTGADGSIRGWSATTRLTF